MTNLASRLCIAAATVAGAVTLAWAATAAAPASTPSTVSPFERSVVQKGASLAAIGDCIVCHTAPEGKAYAGGRAVPTPFGTIYGTNITPDRDTGIGQWTEADFVRAMRDGVDRRGRQLYPAFPYDHFRHVADEDLHALYAFLMTRDAVVAKPPKNELRFPYNLRPLIAGWKLLFLHRGSNVTDARQSAEWNRGAYLVVGLGHCGACHTPRNALGAERMEEALSGGEAEGWHAPAINAASRVAVPWTVDTLTAYLRGEMASRHEVAGGPMQPVVRDLSAVPEDDVRAMATYLVSLQTRADSAAAANDGGNNGRRIEAANASTARNAADATNEPGAAIYRGACASCHDAGRGAPDGAMRLMYSTSARAPTPRNLIQIVQQGITPPVGEAGPWMPGFGGALNDAQMADLVRYVRSRFGREPPWSDVAETVRKVRSNPEGVGS